MIKQIQLTLVLLFLISKIEAQSTIEIKIEKETNAKISFKNKEAVATFDKLDFSKGDGSLVIINETTTDQYKVSFTSGPDNQPFAINANKIPKATGASSGRTSFSINKDGEIEGIVNSKVDPKGNMKIEITDASNPPKSLGNFIIGTKPSGTTTGKSSTKAKTQSAIYQYVKDQIEEKGYRYVGSQNIIIDNDGVIHIYLDENLSPVYSYFPTTAKEGYDKFQFHILSTKEFTYQIESNGKFEPRPIGDDIGDGGFPKIQSSGPVDIFEYPSSIFGPFSGNFPFFIQRFKDEVADISLDRTIKLLKVSRVSLDMGIVSTWLRNPGDISKFEMAAGDTTLVANNPDVRGMMVAMLTFHFKPRNLNIPPRTFNERLGVSVGLALSEKAGTNFLLGLNVEVANGLFFNGGVHFGEINYPINYKKFDFGKQKFQGPLITKKTWDAGAYACVSIDAALFVKAFKTLFDSGSQK